MSPTFVAYALKTLDRILARLETNSLGIPGTAAAYQQLLFLHRGMQQKGAMTSGHAPFTLSRFLSRKCETYFRFTFVIRFRVTAGRSSSPNPVGSGMFPIIGSKEADQNVGVLSFAGREMVLESLSDMKVVLTSTFIIVSTQ